MVHHRHRRDLRGVDLRAGPPRWPGGGHRRRHRVRQVGCPGRPVRDRVVVEPSRVADEHLDTFADVR